MREPVLFGRDGSGRQVRAGIFIKVEGQRIVIDQGMKLDNERNRRKRNMRIGEVNEL